MSARDAFLTAISAAPDDDAPRLIFADWLEEHGEAERAEFIRLDIRLSQIAFPGINLDENLLKFGEPYRPPFSICRSCRESHGQMCEYHAVENRVEKLMLENMAKWFPGPNGEECQIVEFSVREYFGRGQPCGLQPIKRYGWLVRGRKIGFSHRRGFVDSLICSSSTWLLLHNRLRNSNPIRSVTLLSWLGQHRKLKSRVCRKTWTVPWSKEFASMDNRKTFIEDKLKERWPQIAFDFSWL